MGEPNSTGPVFKNIDNDNYFYNSKIEVPGATQTVLSKGVDKISFKAIMNIYRFEYMVRPKYDEVIKTVESCINDLRLNVTKEKNGPQNTFYSAEHVQIGVRWFQRNDEFIIYIQIEHL